MRSGFIPTVLSIFCVVLGLYYIIKSGYFTDGFTDLDSLRYFFSGTGIMTLSLIFMLFIFIERLSDKISRLEGGKDE